jgi:hypothetical protein
MFSGNFCWLILYFLGSLTISAFSPTFKEKLHSAIYTHEFSGQALKDWDLFTIIENSDFSIFKSLPRELVGVILT